MRVLVVEDEPGIANFIRDGLSEEGFAVDIANDGLTGYEMAVSNEYDIILLDWMLPGISGIELLHRLRKKKMDVPVIFLTAKDTTQDTVFGLDSGANDYIKKPFAFAELLARIRAQIRNTGEENNILQLGPIEMNLENHQVKNDGKPVQLTQKEYSLLEFLIRNKGKVCTRTRIIEHVWDIHFGYDTSVIDVYMNFLRKKLDLTKGTASITTIRGVGYMATDE